MQIRWGKSILLLFLFLFSIPIYAQDPTGSMEGQILDKSGGAIAAATVRILHLQTGLTQTQLSSETGGFRFPVLPIGEYEVQVDAPNFSRYIRKPIALSVDQHVRLNIQLEVASTNEVIEVNDEAPPIDIESNVLGKVVNRQEILDLPLNGRNFSQLGLLQLGVVPLTGGVANHGGIRRDGQAYAVNGQRPESNNYLVDGAKTVNRADGGFALKLPIDAIAEFKILTHTAPPEYGGTSGSNTSVVTRSGGNEFHGTIYEFLRNDLLDARNFFSKETEPLKQNQFGAVLSGPIRHNRTFFMVYYEGFRNRQGITRSSTVPNESQRSGDFSTLSYPLINPQTGRPFPNNQIPTDMIDPISAKMLQYYPTGLGTSSLFTSTQILSNTNDQAGFKLDHSFSTKDNASLRYTIADNRNINPFSILGADVPGFPVGNYITTQLASINENHSFQGATLNSFRASFFRHQFFMEKRLSGLSPRQMGFDYDSTLALGEGSPFMNLSGYSSFGDPTIGPRDTCQNSYEVSDALAFVKGAHSLKIGGEFRRNQINSLQGVFSNGVYSFSTNPSGNAFANFLMGIPASYQLAGGDFYRALRSWDLALFLQDEWRANRNFTLNAGLRYEINTPFNEKNNRLNAFVLGRQSTVFPEAPAGILFPGDEGIPSTIAPIYRKGFMPRVGLVWDPTGNGKTSFRASYAIFFDVMANGVGGPIRASSQTLPWTLPRPVSGKGINFSNPLAGIDNPFEGLQFPRPMTIFTIDKDALPPYSQNWNFSIQRALGPQVLEIRYVGTKGTRLPRFIEANPAVYGPGATAANADRRRIYAGCTDPNLPCLISHVGLLSNITNSTYHAGQASLTRQFSGGLSFLISYTFSKTLDYSSSLHLSGPAPSLTTGENDVAQNPFDLRAEHGLSLFDARHRLAMNASWQIPFFKSRPGWTYSLLKGWQVNSIVTLATGSPFTIFDSTNVSLQAPHPPLSGVFASRPDVISNPDQGPHTPEEWISRSAFRRLNLLTEAGHFGNAGRNIARGPGFGNWDLSLARTFRFTESYQLQFRAECFNFTNHPNFGLPVDDLASPNFGRILNAGPARMMQFGLKMMF